ncbi:hypothetical protein K490DRAFT_58016 [Saccharata proteae CBS 121410]|uniref:Uncharacterized protein n=1 Tax=Saccharata proteae CBS 121410 TaxID=1314787 RepID=A0A9P4HVG7_9PEZI|nr:hypothetical protein K490DRAFT_58016 [Saccharata proteae CBS 121410]
MGQRHNRKRTRSRPRNRDQGFRPLSAFQTQTSFSAPSTTKLAFNFSSIAPPPPSGVSFFSNPPAGYWHQQYSAWQNRTLSQPQHQPHQHHPHPQNQHILPHKQTAKQNKMAAAERDSQTLEAQQLRLFGGEKGDETSLCAPMLKVVMDLFDGIDYVDP